MVFLYMAPWTRHEAAGSTTASAGELSQSATIDLLAMMF
jgi:hypothetical protein